LDDQEQWAQRKFGQFPIARQRGLRLSWRAWDELPECEIRLLTLVRSFMPDRDIGVEFVGLESTAYDLIFKLPKRLLP